MRNPSELNEPLAFTTCIHLLQTFLPILAPKQRPVMTSTTMRKMKVDGCTQCLCYHFSDTSAAIRSSWFQVHRGHKMYEAVDGNQTSSPHKAVRTARKSTFEITCIIRKSYKVQTSNVNRRRGNSHRSVDHSPARVFLFPTVTSDYL
ncbi:hypothetical protein ACLOJK_013545 [Asimina triloba]